MKSTIGFVGKHIGVDIIQPSIIRTHRISGSQPRCKMYRKRYETRARHNSWRFVSNRIGAAVIVAIETCAGRRAVFSFEEIARADERTNILVEPYQLSPNERAVIIRDRRESVITDAARCGPVDFEGFSFPSIRRRRSRRVRFEPATTVYRANVRVRRGKAIDWNRDPVRTLSKANRTNQLCTRKAYR